MIYYIWDLIYDSGEPPSYSRALTTLVLLTPDMKFENESRGNLCNGGGFLIVVISILLPRDWTRFELPLIKAQGRVTISVPSVSTTG